MVQDLHSLKENIDLLSSSDTSSKVQLSFSTLLIFDLSVDLEIFKRFGNPKLKFFQCHAFFTGCKARAEARRVGMAGIFFIKRMESKMDGPTPAVKMPSN